MLFTVGSPIGMPGWLEMWKHPRPASSGVGASTESILLSQSIPKSTKKLSVGRGPPRFLLPQPLHLRPCAEEAEPIAQPSPPLPRVS